MEYSLLYIVQQLYWIAFTQALTSLIMIPFVSLPIGILFFFGIKQILKQAPVFPVRFITYIFVAFLFPLIISLLGVLFHDTSNSIMGWVIDGLLFLLLLISGLFIYKEKDRRIFMFALGLFFTAWSFFAGFIAGMSILNDWL